MIGWDGLPGSVRHAVEAETGPVRSSRPIKVGDGCDAAALVETSSGRVFVKATRGMSRRMRQLRNEQSNADLASGIAPAALFAVDAADWLAVGFEYVPGSPAVLTPGSPDLPRVAATLDRIASMPAPDVQPLARRWAASPWWEHLASMPADQLDGWDVHLARELAEPTAELVAGDRLVHTDLHADQFLIDESAVRVVDWGWPAAGAEWVDAAFLAIRLTGAGFTPEEAERWASGLACWTVTPTALTAFVCHVAGLWTFRAAESADRAMARRAGLARRFAAGRVPALTR